MTLFQLEELMLTGNMTHAIEVLEEHLLINNLYETFKQYLPQHHDIRDEKKRPDKVVSNPTNGQIQSKVCPARLSLPIQRKIVMVAAAFLGTPTIEATPTAGKQTDMLTMVQEIWAANKLDYKFRTLAKLVMSERHCAELWYMQDVDENYWDGYPIEANFKLSMRLIANSLGDKLYPVFDEFGLMIGFGRSYFVMTIVPGKTAPEKIMHFDVYTEDVIYESKYLDNVWLFSQVVESQSEDGTKTITKEYTEGVSTIPNAIGKIPVIYYSQPYTEWHDVQELIDRLEKKISNHADTNDYFDSPIIVAKGTISGFAQKGDTGKLLEAENGADVHYLTWDQAPESTKMEIENLQKFIHSYTHTPDIAFENMKGLGVFSGVALKMLFLDAHLKASDKEEIFGDGLQRRINFLKKAISVLDASFVPALPLYICPKFKYFLPENLVEQIDLLTKATAGGILSEQTAIELNPFVNDPVVEQARIKTEAVLPPPTPPVLEK